MGAREDLVRVQEGRLSGYLYTIYYMKKMFLIKEGYIGK